MSTIASTLLNKYFNNKPTKLELEIFNQGEAFLSEELISSDDKLGFRAFIALYSSLLAPKSLNLERFDLSAEQVFLGLLLTGNINLINANNTPPNAAQIIFYNHQLMLLTC